MYNIFKRRASSPVPSTPRDLKTFRLTRPPPPLEPIQPTPPPPPPSQFCDDTNDSTPSNNNDASINRYCVAQILNSQSSTSDSDSPLQLPQQQQQHNRQQTCPLSASPPPRTKCLGSLWQSHMGKRLNFPEIHISVGRSENQKCWERVFQLLPKKLVASDINQMLPTPLLWRTYAITSMQDDVGTSADQPVETPMQDDVGTSADQPVDTRMQDDVGTSADKEKRDRE
ncbi:hypothetical protein M8J77_015095 [Diaphorina citri]|nr:hypothetical protein M8J77_015095 [Diaphorina citri]